MAGLAGLIETFDALQGSIGGQADRLVQQQNTVDRSTRVHCHHVLVGTQDWRWSDYQSQLFITIFVWRQEFPTFSGLDIELFIEDLFAAWKQCKGSKYRCYTVHFQLESIKNILCLSD